MSCRRATLSLPAPSVWRPVAAVVFTSWLWGLTYWVSQFLLALPSPDQLQQKLPGEREHGCRHRLHALPGSRVDFRYEEELATSKQWSPLVWCQLLCVVGSSFWWSALYVDNKQLCLVFVLVGVVIFIDVNTCPLNLTRTSHYCFSVRIVGEAGHDGSGFALLTVSKPVGARREVQATEWSLFLSSLHIFSALLPRLVVLMFTNTAYS